MDLMNSFGDHIMKSMPAKEAKQGFGALLDRAQPERAVIAADRARLLADQVLARLRSTDSGGAKADP